MTDPRLVDRSEYADRFKSVVEHLEAGYNDAAEQILRNLARVGAKAFATGQNLPTTKSSIAAKRLRIPETRYIAVYNRDAWTCRYCGVRTIFLPVLNLISEIFPKVFLYDPHWASERTDAAFSTIGTSCDHVIAHANGGTNDISNLVTACWLCNSVKVNHSLNDLGWTIRAIVDEPWDGLSGKLSALVEAAASKRNYRSWIKAIRDPEQI